MHTLETRAKISRALKGRIFTKETLHKRKISNVRANGKPVMCVDTKEKYESISAAARDIKTAPICVSRSCHSVNKTIRGYRYVFISRSEYDNAVERKGC